MNSGAFVEDVSLIEIDCPKFVLFFKKVFSIIISIF